MADWANIHSDILIKIAEHVNSMESYESFGAVCKSWQAAAKTGHLNQTSFEVPWLMFPENEQEQKESSTREIRCVSLGNKTRKIFLPEASRKRCLSCKDWLFIIDEDQINISLLHPLTRVQIHLPKLTTFPFYDDMLNINLHFVERVVLSENPSSSSDFLVMVIWGLCGQLGFCKPGDTYWTPLDHVKAFYDIVYINNTLYALDWIDRVVKFDIHRPGPTMLHQVSARPPGLPLIAGKKYLVKFSDQKFLIVHRHIDLPYRTKGFQVFEVNIEDGTWLEVKDLGNKALFLGYNSSIFTVYSRFNNFKPNCIYFSDDNVESYLNLQYMESGKGHGEDIGIYHLSDGSIEPIFNETVCSEVTPPIWVGL